VPGEEALLSEWQARDRASGEERDPMTYYHVLQDCDFVQAVLADRPPLVPGAEGRKLVQLIQAIYRSQQEHAPIRVS
jgi:predicted dehydrogenase